MKLPKKNILKGGKNKNHNQEDFIMTQLPKKKVLQKKKKKRLCCTIFGIIKHKFSRVLQQALSNGNYLHACSQVSHILLYQIQLGSF